MRNIFYKLSSLFTFVIAFTATSMAQTGYSGQAKSGSIYSSIGVGSPVDNTSAGLLAQGLLGITNVSRETSAIANPALWAQAFYTQAGTGLQLSRYSVSTENSSGSSTELQSGYLHLLLPVVPGKVGVSVGLYPVTRSNFKSITSYDFTAGTDTEVNFANEINSTGGISKVEAGFGFKLTKNISVGYAPSIAFINSKISEYVNFDISGFTDQYQKYEITGSTFAQRFGITGSFNNVLSSSDRLSVGATLNLPYTIDASQNFTAEKSVEGTIEEVDLSSELTATEGDIHLPQEFAVGIGYAPKSYLNFGAEMQVQSWSDYYNELYPEYDGYLTDRTKIGFGGQYHPYRRGFNSFLSGFKYSAGVSYDSGHLTIQDVDTNEDVDISTLWINTGIGIPSRTASFIDLSLQYGIRGTTSNNLFQENIWSLGLSVNLTELMFVRPKLR